jgi:nucleoid DNA-binding protein
VNLIQLKKNMDIDLLAKMVKEVVMDHDSVTLPGMGSFVAELVPASFADRGYTILPPYRRLYFSPKQGEDRLLVELYAKSNDVPEADAARILVDFISEMKEVLKARKTIVLTGLGRLRATRENHFFFVADEDLDIYPTGYGLQPISLKTHEETPEEVAAAVSNLATIMEAEPVAEPEPIAEPAVASEVVESPEASALSSASGESTASEAVVETPATPEKPKRKNNFWRVTGRIIFILVIIAVVAAVAVAVVGRMAPEWLDGYLYSPEELDILRK